MTADDSDVSYSLSFNKPPVDPFAADIAAAKRGCPDALNRLFAGCRPYLLMVANQTLPRELRCKTAPSDVVQETLLQVNNNFGRFEGTSEPELRAWLRGVLLNNVQAASRRFLKTGMRGLSREVSLDQDSSDAVSDGLADHLARSPGSQAAAMDEARRLAAAMARLPEDHRRVIELRNWEELSFPAIGKELKRSADAARKLWARAIRALEIELRAHPGGYGEA